MNFNFTLIAISATFLALAEASNASSFPFGSAVRIEVLPDGTRVMRPGTPGTITTSKQNREYYNPKSFTTDIDLLGNYSPGVIPLLPKKQNH